MPGGGVLVQSIENLPKMIYNLCGLPSEILVEFRPSRLCLINSAKHFWCHHRRHVLQPIKAPNNPSALSLHLQRSSSVNSLTLPLSSAQASGRDHHGRSELPHAQRRPFRMGPLAPSRPCQVSGLPGFFLLFRWGPPPQHCPSPQGVQGTDPRVVG